MNKPTISTGDKGQYLIAGVDGTITSFEQKKAGDAIAHFNAEGAKFAAWEAAEVAKASAPRGPVTIKTHTTAKGVRQMVVYYGDQTAHGRYPALSVTGSQFRAVLQAFADGSLVKAYNDLATSGAISETWQAEKASENAKPATV